MPADAILAIATEGTCAFCGKDPREANALVASSITTVGICDQCIGLSLSIMADAVGMRDVILPEDPSVIGVSEADVGAIVNAVAGKPTQTLAPRLEEFRCSFCDRARGDVAMLITGPRVFICNDCTARAAALAKRSAPQL